MISVGDTVYLREETIKQILIQHSDKLCRNDIIKGVVMNIYDYTYRILFVDKKIYYHGVVEDFVEIKDVRMQKIKSLYD